MADWTLTKVSTIVTGHIVNTPRGPQRVNSVSSHGTNAVKLHVAEGEPLVRCLDEILDVYR